MRRVNLNIIFLAGCMAVISLAAAFVGYNVGATNAENREPVITPDSNVMHDTVVTEIERPVEIIEPLPLYDSISVPGFDRLIVQGGIIQADNIYNPEQNECYFIVSLMLEDGTEIFRSGILAPGQAVGDVKMLQIIPPGIYEKAIARYSTYALETTQPLNGADITFNLEVLP